MLQRWGSPVTEMEGRHQKAFTDASIGTSVNTSGLDEEKNGKKEEYKWRLTQLLGSEEIGNLEYQSDANSTDSVCTEDYVSKFQEGMVDPTIKSDGVVDDLNENASFHGFAIAALEEHKNAEPSDSDISVSIDGPNTLSDAAAGDTFAIRTTNRQDIVQRFKEELEDSLQKTMSTNGCKKVQNRTNSLESLGGRISRLSQTNVSELQSLLCEEKNSTVKSHNLSEDHEELQISVDSESLFSANKCIPVSLRHAGTVEDAFSGKHQNQQKTSLPPRCTFTQENEENSSHISRPSDVDHPKVHTHDSQPLKETPEQLDYLVPCGSSFTSSSLKILSNDPSLTYQTELMIQPTSTDCTDNFESVRRHNNLRVSEGCEHAFVMFGDDNHLNRSSEHINKSSLIINNTEQSSATFDGSLEMSSIHEEFIEESTTMSHCRIQNPLLHTGIMTIGCDFEAGFKDKSNSPFHQQYLLDRKPCTLSSNTCCAAKCFNL